jgi:RNA polymerase sigma-70 factor (ECF subfamily)
VRRHWRDAFRVAFLITSDNGLAEDLAQEATLRAIRRISTFDRSRELRAWIERIAANCAVDAMRQQQRRPELIVENLADDPLLADKHSDDLAQLLARSVPPDELMSALAVLDTNQRAAVILRHLLDYEPAEIASMVGASAGAVRSRIHRGLNELRAILESREERDHHERAG